MGWFIGSALICALNVSAYLFAPGGNWINAVCAVFCGMMAFGDAYYWVEDKIKG